MSTLPNSFRYHFFPVGQGLFAAGWIHGNDEHGPRYSWVFDCGTSSTDGLLSTAIEQLDGEFSIRRRLDHVTLSHFDHDHISGVIRLIERFKIGTLMLPYMPLARRLILAFAEGSGPYDDLVGFFLNPVAHLLAQGGPGIERILFVRASGGGGAPLPEGTPRDPHWNDDTPDIGFEPDKPQDPDEWLLIEAAREAGSQTRVAFLHRGGTINVNHLWEFVPYNDDSEKDIPVVFRDSVNEERTRLLSAKARRSRNNALRRLQKIYDAQFGDSSEERNVISLFLYSGPIYPSWRHAWLDEAWQSHGSRGLRPFRPRQIFPPSPSQRNPRACSIIYTGDGYLDTADRLQRLLRHFQEERINKTGLFQVMHHGSEANWHKGVAEAIAPVISVFSSDPDRKQWGHPHASVLRDFWPYGPCQVDKNQGVTSLGRLEAR